MTIQRQYNLPNCTLILEGLTDSMTVGSSDFRPLMSILVNAEIRLAGREQPLTGGRDFFESLVSAVSRYAQEILSGVPHASDRLGANSIVQLKKINENLHRLIVRSPQTNSGAVASQSPIQLDLNTVQLFDLVEAVDQFFADARTLPDLSLNLTPVSKQEAATYEPLTRRAMPAAVGLSSLAIAAIAFFVIPTANVRRPTTDPLPQTSSSTQNSSTNTASQTPGASPNAITDPNQIQTLRWKLYEQIDKAWNRDRALTDTALFRVSVDPEGTIVGYQGKNQSAVDNVEKTPLSELVRKQPEGGTTPAQSLAEYNVALSADGTLQVEPWKEAIATPAATSDITDPALLDELKQKLSDNLAQNWQKEKSTFEGELIYRVNVNREGAIASYEALNPPAFYHKEETPLSTLQGASDTSNNASEGTANEKSLAKFRVVFKPSGMLEVSPF